MDSQNETFKDANISQMDNSQNKSLDANIEVVAEDKKAPENGSSNSSSRRESVDDLSFAIESDSSLTNVETNERVLIDKTELENALQHTVQMTKNFPLEVLCDIYVQLSRCVGKYIRLYDRKSLPKVNFFYYF